MTKKKERMKRYLVTFKTSGTSEVHVKAHNADEASQKFYSGEWDGDDEFIDANTGDITDIKEV